MALSPPPFQVQHLRERPGLLDQVIQLGNTNRDWLGFLPEGAFHEYAARDQILIATSGTTLSGYLLYRVANRRATIVHLCVGSRIRGRGVARALVAKLFEVTAGLRGVDLHCRQDFAANTVWPRLGFHHVGSRPGRSKEGRLLDRWWFDYGATDLFTLVEDGRLEVAVDANVFYDISDDTGLRPNAAESLALVADWLSARIRLYVAPEIFNEANRNPDPTSAERSRRAARSFHQLGGDPSAFLQAQQQAQAIVPPRANCRDRDQSDLNHLAHASAAGVGLFVTRDERLLSHADELNRALRVRVLRPVELILRLEDLSDSAGTEPVWLAGTKLEIEGVRTYDEAALSASFYSTARGEKKAAFLKSIRTHFAASKATETRIVKGDGRDLALMSLDRAQPGVVRIPLLRIADRRGAPAVAHSLLFKAVKEAASDGRPFVIVGDPYLPAPVADWLSRWGFIEDSGAFVKLAIAQVGAPAELLATLRDLEQRGVHPRLIRSVSEVLAAAHPADVSLWGDIERALWPAKLLIDQIPTFIVPIQPPWALNLFDERLADQTLFGAPEELALSREGAYYRARHPDPGFSAPARILWYVSQRSRYAGAGALRACSVLDRVDIDTPGMLFKRHGRFGTYKWRDVLGIAHEDRNRPIMALQFSDTELFEQPIPYRLLKDHLLQAGIRTNLQSPVRIPTQLFELLFTTAQPDTFRGQSRGTHRPAVDPTPIRSSHLYGP